MTTGDLFVDGFFRLLAGAVLAAAVVELGFAFLMRSSQEGSSQ